MASFNFQSVNGVIICINEEFNVTFVTEQFQHVFGLEPVRFTLIFVTLPKFVELQTYNAL